MRRALLLVLVAILLLTVGCAGKHPAPEYSVPDKEKLEPELAQPWPELKGPVTLTKAEKRALSTPLSFPVERDEYACRQIQEQFVFLKRQIPDTVARWAVRSESHLAYAKRIFREQGIPEDLAYLPFIESGYNSRAYSHAGAAGMWQFMPFTGRKYGLRCDKYMDERRDPYKATYSAAAYLNALYDMFHDWNLALAAYNCGEGKLSRALEATGSSTYFELHRKNHTLTGKLKLKDETLKYVPRFLAMVKIAKNFELLGFPEPDESNEQDLKAVKLQPGTDLKALARACNMSWESFKDNNLAFRRSTSPWNCVTTAYVSSDKLELAENFTSGSGGSSPKASSGVYIVERGDSWGEIAASHGLTVAELKRYNNRSSNIIVPGQRIRIPESGYSEVAKADTSSKKTSVAKSEPVKKARPADIAKTETKTTVAKAPAPKPEVKVTAAKSTAKPDVKHATYKVQTGDTLYSIARRHGVNVTTLQKVNGLAKPQDLRAGQHLSIPGGSSSKSAKSSTASKKTNTAKASYYKVKKGDTLYSISRKFQVSADDLMRWNKLNDTTIIPGNKLVVK